MLNKILLKIKSEFILFVSFIVALISVFFVPISKDYVSYIDFKVLAVLFSLMIVIDGLQKHGFFTSFAQRLLYGKKRLRLLYLILVLLPFISSMFITNDVALITFVPFCVLILKMINKQEYLIWTIVNQTIAANLGSMATPIGNPQNLYLYGKFSLSFGGLVSIIYPYVLLSLIYLLLSCLYIKDEVISVKFDKYFTFDIKQTAIFIMLFLICLLSVFNILDYKILLVIIVLAILIFDKKLLRYADYSLILTFVCFFVFAGNISRIPQINDFISLLMEKNALVTSIITSQIISNVPSALLLSVFTNNYQALILGCNIGGLGTLIASLASLISFKIYLKSEKVEAKKYIITFTILNVILLVLFTIIALVL